MVNGSSLHTEVSRKAQELQQFRMKQSPAKNQINPDNLLRLKVSISVGVFSFSQVKDPTYRSFSSSDLLLLSLFNVLEGSFDSSGCLKTVVTELLGKKLIMAIYCLESFCSCVFANMTLISNINLTRTDLYSVPFRCCY